MKMISAEGQIKGQILLRAAGDDVQTYSFPDDREVKVLPSPEKADQKTIAFFMHRGMICFALKIRRKEIGEFVEVVTKIHNSASTLEELARFIVDDNPNTRSEHNENCNVHYIH